MARYIAILCKDKSSSFGLHFPDLPGCVAAGETEEGALRNASIALRLWTEGHDRLPNPSRMADLLRDADVRDDLASGAIAVSIPLITSARKVRFNVMLEPSVVEAADAAAAAAGVSRSQYIETALEGSLAREIGAVRIAKKPKTPIRTAPQRRKTGSR